MGIANLGATVYEAISAALDDVRMTIRTADRTEIACICAAIGKTRQNSEIGLGLTPDVQVRVLDSNDPDGLLAVGKLIAVVDTAGTEHAFRIAERHHSGGMTRYVLEAQHGG
jgi:hypothetical protein